MAAPAQAPPYTEAAERHQVLGAEALQPQLISELLGQ